MHQCAIFRVDCVNRCGDMTVFRFFKMVAVCHHGFLKVRNFTYRSHRVGQYASPCQILCQSVVLFGDMADYRFFKMAFVGHLGFVCVYLDHPRRAFVGLVVTGMQNLVVIGAVVSMIIMPVLIFCEFGLKILIHAPIWVFFGIWLPRWDAVSTNLTKVSSTDHSSSSGILLMLVSVVVLEKLPGQKGVTKKKQKMYMNFWRFWRLFTVTAAWLLATFLMSMCSFCGGQHTDTNIDPFCLSLFLKGSPKFSPNRYTKD